MSKYLYRVANEMDAEELLDLLEKFHEESSYKDIEFDDEAAAEYLFSMLDAELVFVAVDSLDESIIGAIGYVAGSLPFNKDYFVCEEKFFYIDKDYRGTSAAARLLGYAEDLLSDWGADGLTLSALDSSGGKIHSFYERKGYQPVEVHYFKEI